MITDPVVRLPRHMALRCNCTDRGCVICDGGLFACVICGGAEGSLPTDCPGERQSYEVLQLALGGTVNYRWQTGWILEDNSYPSRDPRHQRRVQFVVDLQNAFAKGRHIMVYQ